MTLQNKGFNGSLDEVSFAQMMGIEGAEGVDSAASWAVTQGAGRQVSVAASSGWAAACGVSSRDDTGPITAALTTPAAGQWFLVVRRIDWSAHTVTIQTIAHTTTTATIPTAPPTTYPTMNTTPGSLYDQPLAWAWDRNTDTTVAIFDLRTLPVKGRLATLEANGSGRSGATGAADFVVSTISALDGLVGCVPGDTAFMTDPGNGNAGTGLIPGIQWRCISGAGASAKWVVVSEVIAASESNLATFISAVAATADLSFRVGAYSYLTSSSAGGNNLYFRFTSTAGARKLMPGWSSEYRLAANNAWTTTSTQAGAIANVFALPGLGDYEAEYILERGSSAAMAGGLLFVVDIVSGAGGVVSENLGDDIQNARNIFTWKGRWSHTDSAHLSVQQRVDATYAAAGTKTFYAGSKLIVRSV